MPDCHRSPHEDDSCLVELKSNKNKDPVSVHDHFGRNAKNMGHKNHTTKVKTQRLEIFVAYKNITSGCATQDSAKKTTTIDRIKEFTK